MKTQLPFKHIHLVGIGGAGMSAIAQVLLYNGYTVSGSDLSDNQIIGRLKEQGAVVYDTHVPDNINGADLVATSTAIPADNPEKAAAEANGIPGWHRARVLAEIMRAGRSVAVSGTHGKTTTTSLLAWLLHEAGCDPGFLIGGIPKNFGRSFRRGGGDWFVVEGDEYDTAYFDKGPKMWHYLPRTAVVTNVEFDHADIFRDQIAYSFAFERFINLLPRTGKLVVGWASELCLLYTSDAADE